MSKDKIKAFFHDPLDKALDINRHEERAAAYFKIMDISEDLKTEGVINSDHIASAADRVRFPKDKDENRIIINFDREAELTHPLGSGRVRMSDYGYLNADFNEVEKAISSALNEIRNEAGDDQKKLLINLWRKIPDCLGDFELERFKLGNLWTMLPADTRIPDHSIIDHNWLCAAIVASLPNPAFLKFSIGPVQSFITTAKRTEDHWMGSYLLSYLISKAIEVVIDEQGPEHIIFPYIKGQALIDKYLEEKYSLSLSQKSKSHKRELTIPSLSNIIFAILPFERAEDLAKTMKGRMRDAWLKVSDRIREECMKFFDEKTKEIWDRQISDLVEFYYVIYKWSNIDGIESQYEKIFSGTPDRPLGKYHNIGSYWKHMYKVTDAAFNSRKNMRNFEQIKSEDELAKCTMCGDREVIRPADVKKTGELTSFWKRLGSEFQGRIDVKGRDKLCAVCFVKRMAGKLYFRDEVFGADMTFPSIPTISSLDYKIKVAENWLATFNFVKTYNEMLKKLSSKLCNAWSLTRNIIVNVLRKNLKERREEYKEFLDFFSFDGQWIYEESFTKDSLIENEIIKDKEEYEEKREIIEGILLSLKAISKAIDRKPSKYYAVLVMDGDHMGRWLSGTHDCWPEWENTIHSRFLPFLSEEMKKSKRSRNLSPSVHAFISKSLNFFSLTLVKEIVEFEFPGKLVYSGGDDVLAFMPLEYALSAAEKLRFTFSGNLDENNKIDLGHSNGFILLKDGGEKKVIPTMGSKASMSAGIAVAHKNQDLTDVLRRGKSAEHEAKQTYGRDAFCLTIIRHSGNVTLCGYKWCLGVERTAQKIGEIIKGIARKDEEEGLSMSFFSAITSDISKLSRIDDMVSSLFRRQIARNLSLKRRDEESADDFKKRRNDSISYISSAFQHFIEQSKDIINLVDTLLTIRFLAGGGER